MVRITVRRRAKLTLGKVGFLESPQVDEINRGTKNRYSDVRQRRWHDVKHSTASKLARWHRQLLFGSLPEETDEVLIFLL